MNYRLFSLFFTFIACHFWPLMAHKQVRVETLRGAEDGRITSFGYLQNEKIIK
jgi:hypothetical protein